MSFSKAGIPATSSLRARDLGMDAGSGRRRSTGIFRARIAKARRRLQKLKVIKRYNKYAFKLHNTNLWPTATFGASAMGVAPSSIKLLRRHAGQAALGRHGQCSTSAIAIQFRDGADPAVRIRTQIISQWIGIWVAASEEKRQEIVTLWPRQIHRLQHSARWSRVKGPMQATIATLIDLGWVPNHPDRWMEPPPSDILWTITGPGDLEAFKKAIGRSAMASLWNSADAHHCGKGLGGRGSTGCGPDLKSFKRRLKKYQDDGKDDHYMALLVAGSGACWPRDRKYSTNIIGTQECSRCGCPCEDMMHFLWGCPANCEILDDAVQDSQSLAQVALRGHANASLWLRGLPPKDSYPIVEPPIESEISYEFGSMATFNYSQSYYLDGSGGARTNDSRLRRCGWAAITIDTSCPGTPEVTGAVFGPLAGPQQIVPRSELYAGLFVAEATGDRSIKLHSDSKYFVDHCNSRRHKSLLGAHGDLWERWWNCYDLKGGKLSVVKVKAHSDATAIGVDISWQDYVGNCYADKFADHAAEKASLPVGTLAAFDALDGRAWKIQSRIAAIITAGTTRAADEKAAKQHKELKRQQLLLNLEPCAEAEHEPAGQGADFQAPEPPTLPPPPPAQRRVGGPRSGEVHSSHRLLFKQGLHICLRCGAYGSSRARKLTKPCKPPTKSGTDVLRRVADGRTPHHSVDWLTAA